MKKIRNMLFLCIFVFVICVGASFAWYVWQGSNLNVTVDFAGLDPYIDYRESSGDCGTDSLASSAIVFQKKDIGTNLDIYGQLYLHIDSATSNDLFKSSGYKWRLCKIDNNNETTLVSSGNFVGEAVGNNIPLSVDFELDNYSTSADTKYVIETYIDDNNNLDISDSVMVSTWDPGAGEVPSDQGILYIRNIEYSAGKITNLGFYSSKYEITGYKIMNSTTKPSAGDTGWISVTSSEATTEPGYVANVTNVNHTMTNINNICIKDSNGNVTCKSIEKQNYVINDLPSATLCVETTYNGEPHQLVSQTSGTGYELSGYTGTNAGNYTITATLKPGYEWNNSDKTGNITFTCGIEKYDLSNATIAPVSNQTYTGNEIKPTPVVTVPIPSGSTTTLTEGTDFTYSNYNNNINVGINTAEVEITGKGNYKGTKSKTFTIEYELYTITLDPNGGSGGTSTLYERYADGIYLDSGYTKKMTTSENPITKPAKTGYTFDGYYDGDTQMINADGYIITSVFTPKKYRTNKTLTAKWIAKTYTIVYSGNGNTGGSTATQTCTYDSTCTIASNGFTKTGYTFSTWKDPTGDTSWTGWSGTWKYVDGQYGITNNTLTLTAQWTANTYTIVYSGNGNTGGSTATQTCTYDSNCTIASNGFTKTGYTFVGWTTNSDGTDDGYNWTGWSGTWKYVNGQYGIANNTLTLTARWVANNYTVHYYLGNGSSTEGATELSSTTTCTYGSTCTLKSFSDLGGIFPYSSQAHTVDSNITNYSWSFYGWSTSQTGTSRSYADGASFTYSTVGDISLYAIGKKSFSFYGGTTPSKIGSTLYQYWNPYSTSTSYLTSIDIPTQTDISGWTFIGYRAGSNAASSTVTFSANKAGTTQTPSYKTYNVNRSVYSRTLTINYNGNGSTGGSTASTTATQYYNSGKDSSTMAISTPSFTLASNGFTKTDHFFSKWAEGSTSGTQYAEGATYTGFAPSVNDTVTTKTMYAIWIEKVYQIYNSSGTSIGYANSLANAILSVPAGPAGGTIKALKNNSSGAVTVNKNVTLNTNGYTITMNGILTNNSGVTLTVSGSGTIDFPITCASDTSSKCIQNNGTFILNSGTINSDTISSSSTLLYVSNSGVFEMNGGSLISSGHALTTGGETNIYNGSITSTGANGIVIIRGNLCVIAEATDLVDITGYSYGIIAPAGEDNRYSNINVSFSVENANVLKVRATGGQWAAAYQAGSHSTYSVNTTINAGTFYGSGYGILNDAGNTLTINPSGLSDEVVYIESLSSSAIYNAGTLYMAQSLSFSNGIPSAKNDSTTSPYVSVASKENYVLTNSGSGTLYYGYGVFGYCGRASSSKSIDRAIYLPGGTMYLVGGRIYHSNTVDSAFYRTDGTLSVSGSFSTTSGQYSYSARLGGFSFTNTKYSYKAS